MYVCYCRLVDAVEPTQGALQKNTSPGFSVMEAVSRRIARRAVTRVVVELWRDGEDEKTCSLNTHAGELESLLSSELMASMGRKMSPAQWNTSHLQLLGSDSPPLFPLPSLVSRCVSTDLGVPPPSRMDTM